MEVLSDIKIRRGSWASVVAYCSWSTSSNGIGSTTFAPACSINRYYDPSTGSFISVDPDLQQTDEPYVFVNDNPLNSADPLGLKGSIGSMCNGSKTCETTDRKIIQKVASTSVLKILSRAVDAVSNFSQHVTIGYGGCLAVCANVSYQGGAFTFSAGGFGAEDNGPYGGYSDLPISERATKEDFVSVGFGIQGSASVGLNPNGSVNKNDWEVDGGVGGGVGGGRMWGFSIDVQQFLP
jgi:hypothetical protein